MSKKKLNTRAVAAKLSWQVIDKGQSLSSTISEYYANRDDVNNSDRGFVQELVYGVCRWHGTLDHSAAQLIAKPIRNKDRILHFLLLVGIYQLRYTNTAAHASVAETVAACQQLQRPWAKNLINGCLRNYQRQLDDTELDEKNAHDNRLAHPKWIANAITQAWPKHDSMIFAANNQRPPMCLRVNRRLGTRDEYLQQLKAAEIVARADPYSADGLILEKPVGVSALPMFENGAVSVQDTAAQLACDILNVEQGQKVLDACAAPGGKTAHILERADNQICMHALDISSSRCVQLKDTLERLKLTADVFVADASKAASWITADTQYDRILIDAPCSGLGVIRRHPDIKHHRRQEDIVQLQKIQLALLNQLWSLLLPGGLLLYMTCSILPVENEQQVATFLNSHDDAKLARFQHPNALELEFGKQTLPGVHGMDGFYYCLLSKLNA